jgi:hypothetical protein
VSPGMVRSTVYQDPDAPLGKFAAASGMSLADFVHQILEAQHVTTGRMTEAEGVAARSPSSSPTWPATSPPPSASSTAE